MQRIPVFFCSYLASPFLVCAEPVADGIASLDRYFALETAKLANACLKEVQSKEDWDRLKPIYQKQLREMLGLDPWPERSPLQATITGTVDHEVFTVEKLHFQSMPQLYVTANLYVPKQISEPAPGILYVCGHGGVKEDGISLGNKTSYQHHGAWFARHGYVCLTIDTIQLGEIEGLHHGTYREGMWWWNARGYSPAGVEAWNGIRALDYLQSRPEVDGDRIGITGRSGGGAYSWWVAAIDNRIKVAVPVAGITTLKNHVVDGCVEGHCDCMYHVNTYRWDFSQVAALLAPRPLLISNSDKDSIFPLDGVVEVHRKVRRIYELLGEEDKLGLQITEGPHQDTQNLRIHAFDWFNRFLKGEQKLIDQPAVPLFERKALRVFSELPADERSSRAHEFFVPRANPNPPDSNEDWAAMKASWMTALEEKIFRGWPEPTSPKVMKADNAAQTHCFTSQSEVVLPIRILHQPDEGGPNHMVIHVGTQVAGTAQDATRSEDGALVLLTSPRGFPPSAWTGDERKHTQIRRRFMLLGQTLDGMRVWDTVQAIAAAKSLAGREDLPVTLKAEGHLAGIALYASLFNEDVRRLELSHLPSSHSDGPIFLNVLKYLDIPQALALALDRGIDVTLHATPGEVVEFSRQTAQNLSWDNGITLAP